MIILVVELSKYQLKGTTLDVIKINTIYAIAILCIITPGFLDIRGVLKNVHNITEHPMIERVLRKATIILKTTDSYCSIYFVILIIYIRVLYILQFYLIQLCFLNL